MNSSHTTLLLSGSLGTPSIRINFTPLFDWFIIYHRWSYLINLTLIGNAVFVSMDIPDVFLAFSKILNYIRWDQAKMYAFGSFVGVWA